MKIHDNNGKLIGEINTIIGPSEGVITTTTTYSGDRVLVQNISTRDDRGAVKTEQVLGGKVLP